jgi:hypothetical protein
MIGGACGATGEGGIEGARVLVVLGRGRTDTDRQAGMAGMMGAWRGQHGRARATSER